MLPHPFFIYNVTTMMESLRNFLTGPRLFIVIAACALPFVFLGTSSLASPLQNSLGSVNGENVTQEDFQIASNITIQKFKNIYGDNFDFNELDEDIQFEQIKQELILQKVLLSKARSLGLINKESEKESKKVIIKNPAFQVDGVFDEGIYEAQVNAGGYTKESYINLMTDMLAAEQFRIAMGSTSFVTDVEVKELTSLLEQSLDINFIKIDLNSLKKQIINSEDEVKNFYDENQIRFFSNEKRSVNYFLLSASDYKNMVNVPDGYLENTYADYINKINQRDQIRFSHIMLNKAKYESTDASYEQIDLIMSEIKKGISFSELVKKYSDDFVTKDSGGDLEYFDSDVFPVEFSDALSDLAVNEISDVVELDETLHILKVTEFNQAKALTFEEKKVDILDELIEAESLAIMKDNFDAIDQMIASGDSIESIATKLSKEIIESNNLDNRNFMFEITDPIVKDFIFSSDAQIDVPTIIELQDSVIILSLSDILEPQLKTFEDVREEASSYLSESKAIEKKLLLSSEILLALENGSLETFISAYDFISQDSFVGVKRYSSLLPQEVISELFLANEGNSISVDSRSGDKYIVDILKLNRPSKESVEELYTQYRDFSEDRLSETISSMINDDVFSSARINLSDVSF